MKQCDAKDGVADGMIFDPLGCDLIPRCRHARPARLEAVHRTGEGCGHQEGFCGSEERLRHPDLSGLPV